MKASTTFDDIIRTDEPRWRRDHLPLGARLILGNLAQKSLARDLALELGLEVSSTYLARCPLSVVIQRLNEIETAVIKPDRASGSVGVLLLQKVEGRFRNILSGEYVDLNGIANHLSRVREKHRLEDSWIVEELLLPADHEVRPIDDIKIYCFYGRPVVILQRRNLWNGRRRDVAYKWYDPTWKEVATGKYTNKISPSMESPINKDALLKTAMSASMKLPTPFMRIDLYDASRGVIFGEFTPTPGDRTSWNAAWDARLVAEWKDAARRLSDDIAKGHRRDEIDRLIKLSVRWKHALK